MRDQRERGFFERHTERERDRQTDRQTETEYRGEIEREIEAKRHRQDKQSKNTVLIDYVVCVCVCVCVCMAKIWASETNTVVAS